MNWVNKIKKKKANFQSKNLDLGAYYEDLWHYC